MKNQEIRIHNEGNINAIGKYNSGHCKPVICDETGTVYSSVTDAAAAVGCSYSFMNGHLRGKFKSVKGNHYRYLNDALDNPDSVFEQLRKMSAIAEANAKVAADNAEKARKWDELQAQIKAAEEAEAKRLEEERKAEEARLAKIEKVKKKIERRTRVVDNARNHLNNAEQRLADACAELRELEGVSEDTN